MASIAREVTSLTQLMNINKKAAKTYAIEAFEKKTVWSGVMKLTPIANETIKKIENTKYE
jgi:hypothetical protein